MYEMTYRDNGLKLKNTPTEGQGKRLLNEMAI